MREVEIASLKVLAAREQRRLSVQPLPAAIERYFEASLYLLVATGFATLAATGRLDPLALIMVTSALLLRGYLLLRRIKLVIPERWTSAFTILYVLFYVVDYYFLSGAFVPATVHLVLFSLVVKLFSVHRDRDHVYLAVLSFLAVLAAAVMTVDSLFLGAFSLFMLLAVTTFISMEMRRSSKVAVVRARENAAKPMAMAWALSGAGVAILGAVLIFAAGIFFLLPRLSAGYLSNFAPRNEWVSGFSDNVQLGMIGQIKQSDTIVMHVQIEGDHGSATELKWRGIALANFDGRRWFNFINQAGELRSERGLFDLRAEQMRLGNLPRVAKPGAFRPLSYRVSMEPLGTNIVFLASVPTAISSSFQYISLDEGGSVFNLDRRRLTETYTATSEVPQQETSLLRTRRSGLAQIPPAVAITYRQLPHLDPRVRTLAEQITAGAATDYDKAIGIEQYLKAHFTYTLDMGTRAPADPLVYFLFERKQGHCEYFASAMAVMLRTVGVPARIVNGFRGSEYNDLTGSYIVRGRNAHSWVEAYIGGTWVAFDPTPPDPVRTNRRWTRLLLYVDAAREFWREWVILYDFQRQQSLTNTAVAESRSVWTRSSGWFHRAYEKMLQRARRMLERASKNPRPWGVYGFGAVAAIILLLNGPRLWNLFTRQRVARNPHRAPQAAASIWYARLTSRLARRGWQKLPTQTPQEFAATITDPVVAAPVAQFTLHYERARFGESAADAQRLPELFQQIRSL